MAKENISYTTLRLNIDNPKQLRAIQILNNLNTEVHKNKTQFILAAIEFYIDYYGDEYLKKDTKKQKKCGEANYLKSPKKHTMPCFQNLKHGKTRLQLPYNIKKQTGYSFF